MMRAALLALLCACGSSKPSTPAPITNVEPPVDAAVIAPEDAPCPRRCMDTCCREEEICQHGRADDGTMAYCRKVRR